MSYRINLFICDLQYIHFNHINYLLPLALFQRDKIIPARKFIAGKSPVNPDDKIEEEEKCTHKMNESDGTEPIVNKASVPYKSRGAADQITCDTE